LVLSNGNFVPFTQPQNALILFDNNLFELEVEINIQSSRTT